MYRVSHNTLKELGKFGRLHLIDLSTPESSSISTHSPTAASSSSSSSSSSSFSPRSLHDAASISKQQQHFKKRIAELVSCEKKLDAFLDQIQDSKIPIKYHHPQPIEGIVDILDDFNEWFLPIEKDFVFNIHYATDSEEKLHVLNEKYQVFKLSKNFDFIKAQQKLQLDQQLQEQAQQQQHNHQHHHPPHHEDGLELQRYNHPSSPSHSALPLTSSSSSSSSSSSPSMHPIHHNPMHNNTHDIHLDLPHSDVDLPYRSFITGVLENDQIDLFRRYLYRSTRGNILMNFTDIDTPLFDINTRSLTAHSVFHILFVGRNIGARIEKLCSIIKARIYDIPTNTDVLNQCIQTFENELKEKQIVCDATKTSTYNVLLKVAGDETRCPLKDWQEQLKIEKHICHALLSAQHYHTMISIEGWVIFTTFLLHIHCTLTHSHLISFVSLYRFQNVIFTSFQPVFSKP